MGAKSKGDVARAVRRRRAGPPPAAAAENIGAFCPPARPSGVVGFWGTPPGPPARRAPPSPPEADRPALSQVGVERLTAQRLCRGRAFLGGGLLSTIVHKGAPGARRSHRRPLTRE